MKKLIALLVLLAAVAGGILWYKSIHSDKKPNYMTVDVSHGEIIEQVLATGSISGIKEVNVGAQVSGQVQKLYVDYGDQVKKGQLLAIIDPRLQENDLKTAKASYESVKANIRSKNILLKRQQKELERQKRLRAKDAGSESDYDDAESAVQQTAADIDALKAELRQAEIKVSTAETNIGYTKITAPIDGIVIAIVTDEGQTVVSNQSAPTILKIADVDTVTVEAEVSEADVIKVNPGQKACFNILGDPDTKYCSTLRNIEPAPESESSSTTSSSSSSDSSSAIYYNALFDVKNPDHILRKSMTAEVQILISESRNVKRIPISTLRDSLGNHKYTVMVVGRDGHAEKKTVNVGKMDEVYAEITDGIEDNDRIIVGDDIEKTEAETIQAEEERHSKRKPR